MQEHEQWIAIAQEDLAVAKILLPKKLFTPITYHCQQTAEKALKGFLVSKNQEILKTHDLAKLLILCITFDQNFAKLYKAAKYLNPFSTKFRYPSEYDVPDVDEAQMAIKQAQKIMHFVIKKIVASHTTKQNSLF
jgi:HEPN domain-containing protein